MNKNIPDVFSGTIEIDETYIGGQWKNKLNFIFKCSTIIGGIPK
jgi:hypothetical protein